jgi:hypothetical protein
LDHAGTGASPRLGRRPASAGRRVLRDVVVAAASACVLALLVAYALAAPTPELRLAVGQVVPRPGATAVVEGRAVEPDQDGLDGVRITVRDGQALVGAAVSNDAGTFRVDLDGPCRRYDVEVRASWQGSELERRTQRRLCPGDSLPVDARVVTQGHYLWVPGPR